MLRCKMGYFFKLTQTTSELCFPMFPDSWPSLMSMVGIHPTDPSGESPESVRAFLYDRLTPIPWSALDYQEDEGAYVVSYTKAQLQAAPAGSIDDLTREDGLSTRDKTYQYYNAPRYWEGDSLR
ncbi:MAG TPA: hypothetical protein VNO35_04790 [Steroidobacteraceae bacterium]|nr:hypothetical protein [Steroidobacteraceae bacterium]